MTRDELIGKVAEKVPIEMAVSCPDEMGLCGTFYGHGEKGCAVDEKPNGVTYRKPTTKACALCWATTMVALVESCREEAKP
jgi:hypothetical protein